MKTISVRYWNSPLDAAINNQRNVRIMAALKLNRHQRGFLMSETYSLPTEPEGIVPTMIARFNSGKIEAMMSLFAPEAVFVAADGTTVTDRAQIAAELERTVSLGLTMEAKARHMFVADNVAQMVLDWSISGTGPDGKHVHLSGMASDVLRRGSDGLWRVLIDNNRGTAVRRPI